MRVNFELRSDIYAALKHHADRQGRTVSDVLRQQVFELVARDADVAVRPTATQQKEQKDE